MDNDGDKTLSGYELGWNQKSAVCPSAGGGRKAHSTDKHHRGHVSGRYFRNHEDGRERKRIRQHLPVYLHHLTQGGRSGHFHVNTQSCLCYPWCAREELRFLFVTLGKHMGCKRQRVKEDGNVLQINTGLQHSWTFFTLKNVAVPL